MNTKRNLLKRVKTGTHYNLESNHQVPVALDPLLQGYVWSLVGGRAVAVRVCRSPLPKPYMSIICAKVGRIK